MISSESFAEDDLANAAEFIQPVSDKVLALGRNAGAFQGAVVFALDPSNKNIASAIATIEPSSVDLDSRDYRRDNINNRRILLANTAVGEFLTDSSRPRPYYTTSKMNPLNQYVYAERIFYEQDGEQKLVGAVQYAFGSNDLARIPSSDRLEEISREISTQESFRGLGSVIYSLTQRTQFLSRELERGPSVIPNAIVCRMDIQDSTLLDRGNDGVYDNYLDSVNYQLLDLIERINKGEPLVDRGKLGPHKFLRGLAFLPRGDGGNLIIPIPKDFRFIEPEHPDSAKARVFAKREVQPLLDEIVARLRTAGLKHYPVVPPRMRFGVDVGYVEPTPRLPGEWSGTVLTRASKLPTAGAYTLTYSEEAQKMFTYQVQKTPQ